jgi:peptidyl-prolyl cis-trans isomerase C
MLRKRSLILPLLFSLATAFLTVGLIGCGDGEASTQASSSSEDDYQIGEPVTDPEVALMILDNDGNTVAVMSAGQFQDSYQVYAQQNPGVTLNEVQDKRLRRGVAEEFVGRTFLSEEGKRVGISVDQTKIDQQLAQITLQVGGQEQLEQLMLAQGVPLDSLRRSISDDLMLQQVREKMSESETETTDADVEDFRKKEAEEVRAAHILFQVADPAKKDSVIELANSVLDSVKTGTDFAAMAARYGSDGSRTRGGDLGFFSRSRMVKPFSDAAFALADSGAVTNELVESEFGYHIIKLLGRRTAELMDPAQARDRMTQMQEVESFKKSYQGLQKQYVIRINPDIVKADLNAE